MLLLPVLDFFCLQQLHKEIISIKTVNFWCLQLQAKISVVFIPVQYQLFVFTVERQRYQFYYYLVKLNYVCFTADTDKQRYLCHNYWIICVNSCLAKISVALLPVLNYVCLQQSDKDVCAITIEIWVFTAVRQRNQCLCY